MSVKEAAQKLECNRTSSAALLQEWGYGEYTFGAFCKVVRPKRSVDADYVAMYFQSPIYRRLISTAAQGININNIRNGYRDDEYFFTLVRYLALPVAWLESLNFP